MARERLALAEEVFGKDVEIDDNRDEYETISIPVQVEEEEEIAEVVVEVEEVIEEEV